MQIEKRQLWPKWRNVQYICDLFSYKCINYHSLSDFLAKAIRKELINGMIPQFFWNFSIYCMTSCSSVSARVCTGWSRSSTVWVLLSISDDRTGTSWDCSVSSPSLTFLKWREYNTMCNGLILVNGVRVPGITQDSKSNFCSKSTLCTYIYMCARKGLILELWPTIMMITKSYDKYLQETWRKALEQEFLVVKNFFLGLLDNISNLNQSQQYVNQ